jgi:hypothetical protein
MSREAIARQRQHRRRGRSRPAGSPALCREDFGSRLRRDRGGHQRPAAAARNIPSSRLVSSAQADPRRSFASAMSTAWAMKSKVAMASLPRALPAARRSPRPRACSYADFSRITRRNASRLSRAASSTLAGLKSEICDHTAIVHRADRREHERHATAAESPGLDSKRSGEEHRLTVQCLQHQVRDGPESDLKSKLQRDCTPRPIKVQECNPPARPVSGQHGEAV